MKKVMAMLSTTDIGGAQRVAIDNCKYLNLYDDIDFRLYVYESPCGSKYDIEIENNALNAVYLCCKRKVSNIPFIGAFANFIVANRNWRKAIKQFNPDIIHVHITEIFRKCIVALFLFKKKTLYCTIHSNPYRDTGISRVLCKIAFNYIGVKAICLTEQQARMAKEHYGIKNYTILHNGIDFECIQRQVIDRDAARRQYSVETKKTVYLGVGRLDPIKRFDLLIKAFKLVCEEKEDCVLLIAGDGKERSNLNNLISSYELDGKIKLLGNIEKLVPLYCCADLLCMTSFSEASPLSLLESQACGLPSLISDGVPSENIFTDLVCKMPENASEQEWAAEMLGKTVHREKSRNTKETFDLQNINQELHALYIP